ncbi:MAG: hypothetical protein ACFFEJ_16580 [Candidatus Thorarchaeota archaeon]
MERKWLYSVLVRIVIILLLPIEISFYLDSFGYTSVVLQTGEPRFIPTYAEPSLLIILPILLFLQIPGILFDYIQYHKPKEVSVRKYFVGAYIIGNPFIQYFIMTPIVLLLSVLSWEIWMQMQISAGLALLASTWGLLLFVIIPFLSRETRMMKDALQIKQNLGSSRFGRLLSQYDIIAILLGATIFLAPNLFAFYGTMSPFGGSSFTLISGSAVFEGMNYPTSSFTYLIVSGIYYPFMAIVNALYLYFAVNILQYLQGKASRNQCVAIGLVSVVGSPFIIPILPLSYMGTGGLLLPIPITFVLGLLIILVNKPVYIEEPIWDESVEQDLFRKPTHVGESDQAKDETPVTLVPQADVEKKDKSKQEYDWDKKDEDAFGNDTRSND